MAHRQCNFRFKQNEIESRLQKIENLYQFKDFINEIKKNKDYKECYFRDVIIYELFFGDTQNLRGIVEQLLKQIKNEQIFSSIKQIFDEYMPMMIEEQSLQQLKDQNSIMQVCDRLDIKVQIYEQYIDYMIVYLRQLFQQMKQMNSYLIVYLNQVLQLLTNLYQVLNQSNSDQQQQLLQIIDDFNEINVILNLEVQINLSNCQVYIWIYLQKLDPLQQFKSIQQNHDVKWLFQIRSFANYCKHLDIDIERVLSLINVHKIAAFKCLNSILQHQNFTYQKQTFEILLDNWELNIKGLNGALLGCLSDLLKTMNRQQIQESILLLQQSQNKRKYCILNQIILFDNSLVEYFDQQFINELLQLQTPLLETTLKILSNQDNYYDLILDQYLKQEYNNELTSILVKIDSNFINKCKFDKSNQNHLNIYVSLLCKQKQKVDDIDIEQLIYSQDQFVVLNTLDYLVNQFNIEVILKFTQFCGRTSCPEFRQNIINRFKTFFLKLRESKLHHHINRFISILDFNIDSNYDILIFQMSLLKYITLFFQNKDIEYKGKYLKAYQLNINQQMVIVQLGSKQDNIRQLAYQILLNLQLDLNDKDNVNNNNNNKLININNNNNNNNNNNDNLINYNLSQYEKGAYLYQFQQQKCVLQLIRDNEEIHGYLKCLNLQLEQYSIEYIELIMDELILVSKRQIDNEYLKQLVFKEASSLFYKIISITNIFDSQQQQINEQKLLQLCIAFRHLILTNKYQAIIEKISMGFSLLSQNTYNFRKPLLKHIPKLFIDEIIQQLKQNDYQNITRRSMGLPYYIMSLLNAEPPSKRNILLPHLFQQLIQIQEQCQIESKVHAINIIKHIIADQHFKKDTHIFISQSFQISIHGFQNKDWSIRNSYLMLFSALCKRIFSTNINIIEFFVISPNLVQVFKQEIKRQLEELENFKNQNNYNNKNNDNDNKDKDNDNDNNDQNFNIDQNVNNDNNQNLINFQNTQNPFNNNLDQYPSLYPIALLFSKMQNFDGRVKFKSLSETKIELSDLKDFLPLLIQSCNHKNYFVRLMISKSICALISNDQIIQQVKDLLNQIQNLQQMQQNHNKSHGLLLIILQLIKQLSQQDLLLLYQDIKNKQFLLTDHNCALIRLVYIKIILIFQQNQIYDQFLHSYLKQYIHDYNIKVDLGDTQLLKKVLKLYINQENSNEILTFYSLKLNHNYDFSIFEKVLKHIKHVDQSLIKDLFKWESIKFLRCIKLLLKIYNHQDLFDKSQEMIQKYPLNSNLHKAIIKYQSKCIKQQNQISQFINNCVTFSQPNQKDFIRKQVAKSLDFNLIQNNEVQFFQICLNLIQDENNEIRDITNDFINKFMKSPFITNITITVHNLFKFMLKYHTNQQEQFSKLYQDLIFNQESDNIKLKNHQENQLFSYELNNNFIDISLYKTLALENLIDLKVNNIQNYYQDINENIIFNNYINNKDEYQTQNFINIIINSIFQKNLSQEFYDKLISNKQHLDGIIKKILQKYQSIDMGCEIIQY